MFGGILYKGFGYLSIQSGDVRISSKITIAVNGDTSGTNAARIVERRQ